MRRILSTTDIILISSSFFLLFKGVVARDFESVKLRDWSLDDCLCLGVEFAKTGQRVIFVDCDDTDHLQRWNFDDKYRYKFLLQEQDGDDDLCITMPSCYLDDSDICEDETDLPPLLLRDCRDDNDNDEEYQMFRYDPSYLFNAIVARDLSRDDTRLCATYDVGSRDPRQDDYVVMKECADIDNNEEEYEWVFRSSIDSSDCDDTAGEEFNLLVLQDDESLCACCDNTDIGTPIELCECIEDDEDSIESQLQQWNIRDTGARQQWRPMRNNGRCVTSVNGAFQLADCSESQNLLWEYDELDDKKLCLWISGEGNLAQCAAPDTSRRALWLGFGTRGGSTGPSTQAGRTSGVAGRGDTLRLTPRSDSSAFKIVDVRDYNFPSQQSGRTGSQQDDFKIYRLDDGPLCIGTYENAAGQYLELVPCSNTDESEQWNLVNNYLKWENLQLQDSEDPETELCVTTTTSRRMLLNACFGIGCRGRGGDTSSNTQGGRTYGATDTLEYLVLDFCGNVQDEWTYGDAFSRAISPRGDPTRVVTFCPDYGRTNDDPAQEGDPLCLSNEDCDDGDSEDDRKCKWYSERADD